MLDIRVNIISYIFKLFFISIIIFIIYSLVKESKGINKNIKVCICTIGKEENKYIREFVEYGVIYLVYTFMKNLELIKYSYMIIMIKTKSILKMLYKIMLTKDL